MKDFKLNDMKKTILLIVILSVIPKIQFAQDGNASLWENEARISGAYNSVLGEKAGASTQSKANVYIGYFAGVENRRGDGNVFLGYQSGLGNGEGSGNVFLGSQSGSGERGSNLLYIENSKSDKPLIWGTFEKDIVNINGRLGVNTTSPLEKLHIAYGNLMLEGDGEDQLSIKFKDNDVGDDYKIGIDPGQESMKFDVNGVNIMTLKKANGNVGIGTITPDEKLTVNGKIHTKEVRVDLEGWPDYVFAKNYILPTLLEVEKHIKSKGHLQNIPSAEEVTKNGIHLGEMNAKLLEKIEELTLYTIQQQKELNSQKEKNSSLEERLKKLETLIKE